MEGPDDWYAVTTVFTSKHGLFATLIDPVSVGSDHIEVIKRRRLRLERRLTERTGMCYTHLRPGCMYAVWRFSGSVPKSEVKDAMTRTRPWRVLVLTSSTGWQDMAELCLPEDVDLFAEKEET